MQYLTINEGQFNYAAEFTGFLIFIKLKTIINFQKII